MLDQSLLQSHFIGRDGFRWWIGQIPPSSEQQGQLNGSGWGNRFKVRIMGYHPANEQELKNEDLPWAQVLLPPTAGTGGGNRHTSVLLTQGDVVFGFFLDGDNAQIPVIVGAFGKTGKVSDNDYSAPFVPFTGYTENIKKPPKSVLKPDQSGDQNADSQKSPRHVSPSQAASIFSDEVSYFSAIGDSVKFANESSGSTISKISTEIDNFLKFVKNISTFISAGSQQLKQVINYEIDRVTQKIKDVVTGLVNGMVYQLYKKLAPIINKGLKLLYKLVYKIVLAATGDPPVAHLAGVAAQEAMVIPVSNLQKAVPSIANKIIDGLSGVIKSILNSVVDNITNFVTCVANQFTGVLVNDIIGKVAGRLSSLISVLQPVFQFFSGFSVENLMRSGSDILSGFGQLINAGQSAKNFEASGNEWIIGRGMKTPGVPNFSEILRNANDAFEIATSVGKEVSATASLIKEFGNFAKSTKNLNINECYSGPPLSCNAPKINIFGSNGSGAKAIPILGNIVGKGKDRTGSIIGIKVVNRGSNYDFSPFVEIVDNCEQGYGAIARAVLNDKKQIDYIYIVSEGERYPIGDLPEYVIDDVAVIETGTDYEDGDYVVDNFGNEYNTQVLNGGIIQVKPIIVQRVTELPILTVISANGSGAILSPILDNPPEILGEPQKVVDCIT